MNGLWASTRHEVLSIFRARVAQLLLIVFVGMVSVSAVIGWLTTSTVTSVYDRVLADGLTTAPNPFVQVPPLYYARNAVVYVVLIGCLMAIVLGVQATLRDRKQRTAPLILTRPLTVRARLGGQLLGIGLTLAGVLAISAAISWVSIAVITAGPLGVGMTGRLLVFTGAAWVLLMIFAIIGMVSGLVARRESTAFLVPFVLWSAIAFVLPQLGTAARPVALLNPVPSVAASGDSFALLSAITGPLAITEQFKTSAGILLQNEAITGTPAPGIAILAACLLLGVIAICMIPRSMMRSVLHD